MTCTCHIEHTAVVNQLPSGKRFVWVNHPDDCEFVVKHRVLVYECEWAGKSPAGLAVHDDEAKGRLPKKDGIYAVAFDGNKVTYTEVDHDDGASTEDT